MKILNTDQSPSFEREMLDLLDQTSQQISHLNDIIKKMKGEYLQSCQDLSKTKSRLEDEKENKDSTNEKLQLNIRILVESLEVQTKFNATLSNLLEKTLTSKTRLCKLKKRFLKLVSTRVEIDLE